MSEMDPSQAPMVAQVLADILATLKSINDKLAALLAHAQREARSKGFES